MTSVTHGLDAASLVAEFSAAWQAATRHPFLDAVADGSLPPDAFTTWLAQDYLFVRDLLAFQAHLLARAPRSAQAVLASGLVALEAELSWFEAHAGQRGMALDVGREPATARYRALLAALDAAPYPAAITGLWAVERAYLDAWLGARPGTPAYREFVDHWTVDGFGDYVRGLEQAADLALVTASSVECQRARTAFGDVARIEREFWDMAWS